MHFAICMWGIVRSLRFTIHSMHQYCLDPLIKAGHTYEIFMHTYKFSGIYDNERNNEHAIRLNFSEWKMLSPDHIYVEDQDLFDSLNNYAQYKTQGDPWKNNYLSFTNHMRALNSLHYLASEVEKRSTYTQFDGVLFIRPDVTFLNELPFYLLEHIPNALFMPDFHRSCKGGEYNERMAMGDLQSALAYGKRLEGALEYSLHKQLHSEKFTYEYLHSKNVTVFEMPFRFRRTRASGEFHVRDEKAIVSPRFQSYQPEYTTPLWLRWVYTAAEYITMHRVYIWNHDDDENLYCKPNPYISPGKCREYRKLSRKNRLMEIEKKRKYRNSATGLNAIAAGADPSERGLDESASFVATGSSIAATDDAADGGGSINSIDNGPLSKQIVTTQSTAKRPIHYQQHDKNFVSTISTIDTNDKKPPYSFGGISTGKSNGNGNGKGLLSGTTSTISSSLRGVSARELEEKEAAAARNKKIIRSKT